MAGPKGVDDLFGSSAPGPSPAAATGVDDLFGAPTKAPKVEPLQKQQASFDFGKAAQKFGSDVLRPMASAIPSGLISPFEQAINVNQFIHRSPLGPLADIAGTMAPAGRFVPG